MQTKCMRQLSITTYYRYSFKVNRSAPQSVIHEFNHRRLVTDSVNTFYGNDTLDGKPTQLRFL